MAFDPSQPRDEQGRWSDTGGGGMSWKTAKGTEVRLEGTRLIMSAGPLAGGSEYDGYEPVRPNTAKALVAKGMKPEYFVQVKGHNVLFEKSDTDRLDEAWKRARTARANQRAEFDRNVPGYHDLRAEIVADESHQEKVKYAIEKGWGHLPEKRVSRVDELSRKYPAARAYLKAEAYSRASHDQKAAAGQRAMERIKKGEPAWRVEADMEKEWSEAASKSVWNA